MCLLLLRAVLIGNVCLSFVVVIVLHCHCLRLLHSILMLLILLILHVLHHGHSSHVISSRARVIRVGSAWCGTLVFVSLRLVVNRFDLILLLFGEGPGLKVA